MQALQDELNIKKEIQRNMCIQFDKLVNHEMMGYSRNREISNRSSHSVQGTFWSQFYVYLNDQINKIVPTLSDNFWRNSTILDCGSGSGLALFGFNFILNCQHLLGIEIQNELGSRSKTIAETLIKHNSNRSNWKSMETLISSVDNKETAHFYKKANFIITMNIKFDAKVNEGMCGMITAHCQPGTIVLALLPLTGQRRPKRLGGIIFDFTLFSRIYSQSVCLCWCFQSLWKRH